MTEFWLGAGVLGALLVYFLAVPLLRKGAAQLTTSETRQNVDIFRDRLKELEEDERQGVISHERFEQLKSELEANLLEDASTAPTEESTPGHLLTPAQSLTLLGGMLAVSLLIVVGVYAKYGAYDAVEEALAFQALQNPEEEHVNEQQIVRMVASLEAKLKADPGNLDGWFLLARSYMNMERYGAAADAYGQAIPLIKAQNENPAPIYGLQAQARFFANQGQFTDEVRSLIDQAFAHEPDEPNTLGLLGMIAMQRGDYEAAIQFWGRILATHPDHPSRDTIAAGIEQAKAQLAQVAAQQSQNDSPVAAMQAVTEDQPATVAEASTQLRLTVTLDDNLRAQTSTTDTVFVYARPVNGPKMPLAIVRKTVADLPLSVTLDDTMAMAPSTRLSQFPEVELVARVSKQGTPAANPGDLEGTLAPVPTKGDSEKVYQLVISNQM